MKVSLLFLLVLTLTASFNSFAQKTFTGDEAADWVQKQRDIANDLFDEKHTPEEINRGVIILKNALSFLDSLPIKELATTNAYLWYRRTDANRDLASGYALLNKKDSAIMALNRMYANGTSSIFLKVLQDEPTLNSIKNEPGYLAIIRKLSNQRALWTNAAFKSPFKTDLSPADKVAGLSLLWSQAKYNFVHFDHADIDWNQAYLDYLPKVQSTTSTSEYYKLLIMFYAQLKDGHTNVYVPDSLSSQFYSRPPLRTELIEGRVFVSQVFSDSLSKMGIVPGLEVTKIDNQPTIAYAETYIKPYQSSSTPQDMEIREFSYALLAGAKNKPVTIEFKDSKGNIVTKNIARTGYHDIKSPKAMSYQTVGKIGYLTINSFEDVKIVKQFDSLYTDIAKTKGLIIDIRYNGGGDGGLAFNIIKRLTDKPFYISSSKVLRIASRPNAEPQWEDNGTGKWNPNGKIFYNKPIVLLIGPRTFSAAEDFAVVFDYMKRGKLVGLPTGGSTGQPVPLAYQAEGLPVFAVKMTIIQMERNLSGSV